MPYYEVTYYKKVLKFRKVKAKTKAEAKELVYNEERQKEKDALHQFTVHRVDEAEHNWNICPDCIGTGCCTSFSPYSSDYTCLRCKGVGGVDDHILNNYGNIHRESMKTHLDDIKKDAENAITNNETDS